ncbi:SafA/ExsA family spore coat assembly protein [Fredinandcohnia sp. QZ13]|uniref:SafA/ExsA family spore coat assembly protein n=1 Tax=Fredinandcohnia sp. QZ13 TaxID=3073144 RepID=UPI0028536623|nr:SafA/ExsA family spore coat assembly protein [Fredinandcohnia sp. QZ13]MDR4889089.1 SafA/ExsA family spore coat assembly protein [Fredinandcohnia sp. QZ13]
MKIHIVQKGDTLWEIAKKYGVDFQELKAVNTQLSNPDMIMPGMKIKVPTGTVHVKKEAQIGGVKQKEAQIHVAPKKEAQIQHPFAIIAPQPFPVMEIEEEEEEVKGVETGPYIPQMPQMPVMPQMPAAPPQMPVMPQMPQYQPLEIDINNYNVMQQQMLPTPPQNVLPGMFAPEEEELEEDFESQMPIMPQMPLQHPAMFNNCVPMTPVMPGYGFNYVPGYQGGFPPQGPFNPMGGFGGFPRTEGVKEEVKEMAPIQMPPVQMPQPHPFEIDINNFNVMQTQMQMPQMVAGVEGEMEEIPEMPMVAPMQAPPMPMGPCVPISPVMPGSGFNFVPGFQGGFPSQVPFSPMGGFPRTEGVKEQMVPIQMPQQHPFEIDINNLNVMQTQMQMPQMVAGVEEEMGEVPVMPQMGPMQAPPMPMGPCAPISPVMPGSGFNPGFPGPGPMPYGSGWPMQATPQAVGPAMGYNPFGTQAPGFAGPMNPQMMPAQFYNQRDCGCGGPKQILAGQLPQQGFPGYQGAPFGMNPNQQMAFNPMFNMPDVDDDLDD